MKKSARIHHRREVLGGKPVIRGTRLSVDFIVGLLADGWSEADILANYPSIEAADITACLQYASRVLRMERAYPLPRRLAHA